MTDEKLLQKAARGDEDAFLTLYERHRATVFRFGMCLAPSRHEYLPR